MNRYEELQVPESDGVEEKLSSMENTAVFTVSMFQYVVMAIVFAKGRPFRAPIFTNCIYLFDFP